MVNVITQILFNRSLDKVASYAANPDHATEWYQNIQSVVWKTDWPLKEGTEVAFVAHFMGKKLVYTYEVVSYLPNEKLVMQTAQGPFPMQTIYRWEALDKNQTRMTLQNTGHPSGFSKLLVPFLGFMIRRANQKDLRKIKTILENQI